MIPEKNPIGAMICSCALGTRHGRFAFPEADQQNDSHPHSEGPGKEARSVKQGGTGFGRLRVGECCFFR